MWTAAGLVLIPALLVAQWVVGLLVSAAFGWATIIGLGAGLAVLVLGIPVALFAARSGRAQMSPHTLARLRDMGLVLAFCAGVVVLVMWLTSM